MRSSGQARKGPPDAVSSSSSTASLRSKSNTWNIALCSESTGNKVAPCRPTSRITRSPALTRHSLLAKAITAPRRTAAISGFSPAAPTIAAMTQSAGRSAAEITASGPAATSIPLPDSASLSALYPCGSARATKRGRSASACRASNSTLLFAVTASMWNLDGLRWIRSIVLHPTDPVEPRIVTLRGATSTSGNVTAMPVGSRRPGAPSHRPPKIPPETRPADQAPRHARGSDYWSP